MVGPFFWRLQSGILRVVPNDRNRQLQDLAQRAADALPLEVAEEVVLTGSVSRGVADEVSDIEMLIVTPEQMELAACFELARAAGLEELDTWGDQSTPTRRVSGLLEGVSLELIWWSREYAESSIDSLFNRSDLSSAADAIAHGVALRTSGSLSRWQARLSDYPEELARARIEYAALPWGGFAAAGLLTLIRPGERFALTEWMYDGASRVLSIVFALNRVWLPTTKRLEARVASLALKPARLAERIDEAFAEPDLRRALLVMTELQLETVALAPDGPNVNRARRWLAAGANLLSSSER
jgi:predicted nucleotidyltransferase